MNTHKIVSCSIQQIGESRFMTGLELLDSRKDKIDLLCDYEQARKYAADFGEPNLEICGGSPYIVWHGKYFHFTEKGLESFINYRVNNPTKLNAGCSSVIFAATLISLITVFVKIIII